MVDGVLLEPLDMREIRLNLRNHRQHLPELLLRLHPLLRLLLRLL